MCNKEKAKMCKFLLTGCLQNILCKTCAIRFLMSLAFLKGKNYPNLTTEMGQNKDLVCVPKDLGKSIKARF